MGLALGFIESRHMKARAVWLLLLLGLSPPGRLAPQVPIIIPEPTAPCSLALEDRGTFSSSIDDEFGVSGRSRLVKIGSTTFIVPVDRPGVVLISRDGRRSAVGRLGQGPGEFQDIVAIGEGAGDSLWVRDMGNRVHLLDGDGRFGRTVILPFSPYFLVAWQSRGLLVGQGPWY